MTAVFHERRAFISAPLRCVGAARREDTALRQFIEHRHIARNAEQGVFFFINLLKELQQKLNISYIFISHDLGVVKHIADRVMVMYRGHVVEEGTRDEIFSHPKHDYTKLLLSSIPRIGEKMDFEAFDSSYQACYDELDKENS